MNKLVNQHKINLDLFTELSTAFQIKFITIL